MAQSTDHQVHLKLLLKAGQLLLESGAETYRAEDAALYMFRGIGQGEISIFAVPTVLIVEMITEDGTTVSGCKRIRRRAIDLDKISQINNIVRKVSQKELEAEEALEALEALDRQPGGNFLAVLFSTAAAAGAFSLLFGGKLPELLFAFFSCLLAQLIGLFFRSVSMHQFFNSLIAGLVPTLIMAAVGRIFPQINEQAVIVGSMLPLFPGVTMVNAIRDAINGDLVSGVSRAAEAILIAAGLGIGASLIFLPGVM